jgi:DNA-binding PadR family transcriptional regulator
MSPPVFHVLLALGDETLHGYAIMQSFEQLTGGAEQLLPGTLYSTLARMLENGLIEETAGPQDDVSGGPSRRHYRVTARGRSAAREETERMRRLVDIARRRAWLPKATG